MFQSGDIWDTLMLNCHVSHACRTYKFNDDIYGGYYIVTTIYTTELHWNDDESNVFTIIGAKSETKSEYDKERHLCSKFEDEKRQQLKRLVHVLNPRPQD